MGAAQRGWRNTWRRNGLELKGREGKSLERREDQRAWILITEGWSHTTSVYPPEDGCALGCPGRGWGVGGETLPIVLLKITEKSPWAGAWQKSSRSACRWTAWSPLRGQ